MFLFSCAKVELLKQSQRQAPGTSTYGCCSMALFVMNMHIIVTKMYFLFNKLFNLNECQMLCLVSEIIEVVELLAPHMLPIYKNSTDKHQVRKPMGAGHLFF